MLRPQAACSTVRQLRWLFHKSLSVSGPCDSRLHLQGHNAPLTGSPSSQPPGSTADSCRPSRPTFRAASATAAAPMTEQAYTTQPLPGSQFGAEVFGFSLTQPLAPDVIEGIKRDVAKHQVVVFRDQGVVSGEDQVRISSWFGELESTFYKHPKSPHPDVFRVSNDKEEGCTGVGRTGWHIDGSFQVMPFSHSLYHIVACPKAGATVFASLYHLIEALPEEQRQKWERLWPASDRRGEVVHPLIYMHPETGMTAMFAWDLLDEEQRRAATDQETVQLLDEIDSVFRGPIGKQVTYEHVWRPGDFIISDNLAVAHEAHPSTQLPVSKVGLRVMHRCTVAGTVEPDKTYE